MEDLISKRQNFNASNEPLWKNVIRFVLLSLNVYNVGLIVSIYNWHRLMMFFTNWTLLVTTLYLAVAIIASRTRSLSVLASHHILFEISFMMNFITCSVFWAVLFDEAMEDCHGDEWQIFNLYFAHIVPGMSALINFALTDVVLARTHV